MEAWSQALHNPVEVTTRADVLGWAKRDSFGANLQIAMERRTSTHAMHIHGDAISPVYYYLARVTRPNRGP